MDVRGQVWTALDSAGHAWTPLDTSGQRGISLSVRASHTRDRSIASTATTAPRPSAATPCRDPAPRPRAATAATTTARPRAPRRHHAVF
eukprot:273533-Chlamydomonas_euryale.AAC.1